MQLGLIDPPATPDPYHRPRRDDRTAPLEIDDTDWAWIPALLLGLFTILMLMSVKSKRFFGGLSLRLYLMRYVSVEVLYNTLKGADYHHWKEQYDTEIGHQVFTISGLILLVVNVFFNPNADKRYAMAVLTYLQMLLMLITTALDVVLIVVMKRVDIVRSVNTKLRFSQCVYQVIVFCSTTIGGSLHLPVDCFIWATIHYSYEAVGLALEGLNVIGMSEFAIISLVNAQILGTEVAAVGWTCAFGLSSLGLSVLSMVGGQAFKWIQAYRTTYRVPKEEEEGEGDHHHHPHPHPKNSACGLHHHSHHCDSSSRSGVDKDDGTFSPPYYRNSAQQPQHQRHPRSGTVVDDEVEAPLTEMDERRSVPLSTKSACTAAVEVSSHKSSNNNNHTNNVATPLLTTVN